MNSLTIIYLILCLIVGFMLGMIVQITVNLWYVRRLENENKHLRKDLANRDVKVIEINDYRDIAPNGIPEEDYFRPW